MTPKEKAEELVHKFDLMQTYIEGFSLQDAKECALIAVDEILLTLNKDIRDLDVVGSILLDLIKYWQEVKHEIELL